MTAWQIAFETSGRQGSVALLRQDELVEQIVLPATSRTAQTLAPAVRELLGTLSRWGGKVGFVSAGMGPGSFTGLRIGVTAAKTLAFALGCPVVGCDCLQVIIAQNRSAHQADSAQADSAQPRGASARNYDAVINAYRGQVFARRESADGQVLLGSHAEDLRDWIASLSGCDTLVAGDVLERIGALPEHVWVAPADLWTPTAAEVGRLGWQAFTEGRTLDPFALQPMYLRESAAVEKRNKENRQ